MFSITFTVHHTRAVWCRMRWSNIPSSTVTCDILDCGYVSLSAWINAHGAGPIEHTMSISLERLTSDIYHQYGSDSLESRDPGHQNTMPLRQIYQMIRQTKVESRSWGKLLKISSIGRKIALRSATIPTAKYWVWAQWRGLRMRAPKGRWRRRATPLEITEAPNIVHMFSKQYSTLFVEHLLCSPDTYPQHRL